MAANSLEEGRNQEVETKTYTAAEVMQMMLNIEALGGRNPLDTHDISKIGFYYQFPGTLKDEQTELNRIGKKLKNIYEKLLKKELEKLHSS